jgi:hypothetical protein
MGNLLFEDKKGWKIPNKISISLPRTGVNSPPSSGPEPGSMELRAKRWVIPLMEVGTISGSSGTKGSFRSAFPGLKLFLTGLMLSFILFHDRWMGIPTPERISFSGSPTATPWRPASCPSIEDRTENGMNIGRGSILTAVFFLGVLSIFSSGSAYSGQAERTFALPELERPRQIVVEKERVYFVDQRDIVVYYLSDGLFLKKIGKLGQGPGEFATGPHRLAVLGDRLIVQDLRSSEWFDLDGNHIGGHNDPDPIGFYQFLPVGRNFVGFPWLLNADGSLAPPSGRIYDSHLKLIREFFGELPAFPEVPPPPGSGRPAGTSDRLLIRDYGDYIVYEDRIYVVDSRRGFSISVFDENGNLLREIKHPVDKIKVPKSFVRDVVKEWKASKDWQEEYSHLNPAVPECFPAIIDLKIDDGRIYALTPARKDDLYEIVVMDLEGNILGREFRFPLRPNFEEPFFNGFRYDIEGDKLVWFGYNDDKEVYELHVR